MPPGAQRTLTQALLHEGIATEERLEQAFALQREEGMSLLAALRKVTQVEESRLLGAVAKCLDVPPIDLSRFDIDRDLLALLPEQMIKRYKVIPISRLGNTLSVAMADPTNVFALDDLRMATGYNIECALASEAEIDRVIAENFGEMSSLAGIFDEVSLDEFEVVEQEVAEEAEWAGRGDDTPVTKYVNWLLQEAVDRGASDIFLEPWEQSCTLRYRVDGMLMNATPPPRSMHDSIVSRIKVLSRLDISERRLPQDGRFRARILGREVDFRVSVIPSVHGEKAVIRVLDKAAASLDLESLGFSEEHQELIKKAAKRPHGMILASGPTGMGKTMTLYSILRYVDSPDINIMTIEDPIELEMPGINQVLVRPEVNLTFARALRAFLRQDPDVILVGEIRDLETTDVAIKAALTGHLVLSTIHTTSAPGTIVRLVDMGVEPFLISSALILVIAQRLVRRVCRSCAQEVPVRPEVLARLGLPPDAGPFYKGKGCDACEGTGYKGRMAIAEVLPTSPELRALVLKRASMTELKRACRRLGMKTIREDGLEKAAAGLTTLEEVLRLTPDDERMEVAE